MQNYNRDDVCNNGVCAVQPNVVFGLSADHTWYVRARNADGNSNWVESRFHFRDSAPAATTLTSPTGQIESTSPAFIWVHASGIEGYRLHVRDLTLGKNLLLRDYPSSDICTGTECQITVADLILPENQQLFFRVRGENSGGRGDWSDTSNFEVQLASSGAEQVIISEFVASNQEGLVDNTGDNSDWIELHNNTDSLVDLSGWTLTAGSDVHVFDGTVIDAGEYLIIFASGKPSRTIRPLH